MPASAQRYFSSIANEPTPVARSQSAYPRFYEQFNAAPERKWEVEVVSSLVKYAQMPQGWDSYNAQPLRRDAGLFALEILHSVMGPRTPVPQVIPSSQGGVQLEWHEKGVDLELHIAAPYECELWFRDHQDADAQPLVLELSSDFSALKKPIALLSSR
jgi:hypothetical protein